MGFSSSVSLLPAIQTTGLWLLPRRVYPPLNAPAFADAQVLNQILLVASPCAMRSTAVLLRVELVTTIQ